jgi:hypothetical protein
MSRPVGAPNQSGASIDGGSAVRKEIEEIIDARAKRFLDLWNEDAERLHLIRRFCRIRCRDGIGVM